MFRYRKNDPSDAPTVHEKRKKEMSKCYVTHIKFLSASTQRTLNIVMAITFFPHFTIIMNFTGSSFLPISSNWMEVTVLYIQQ